MNHTSSGAEDSNYRFNPALTPATFLNVNPGHQSAGDSQAVSSRKLANIADPTEPAIPKGFEECDFKERIGDDHRLAPHINFMKGAYLCKFKGSQGTLMNPCWIIKHGYSGHIHYYSARHVYSFEGTEAVEPVGMRLLRKIPLAWSNGALVGKCPKPIRL